MIEHKDKDKNKIIGTGENDNNNRVKVDEYFENDMRIHFWPKEIFGGFELPQSFNTNKHFLFLKRIDTDIHDINYNNNNIVLSLLRVNRHPDRKCHLQKDVEQIRMFTIPKINFFQLPEYIGLKAKEKAEKSKTEMEKQIFIQKFCHPSKEKSMYEFLFQIIPEYFIELYAKENDPNFSKQIVKTLNVHELALLSLPSFKDHLFKFYSLNKQLLDLSFRDNFLKHHNFYAIFPNLYIFSQLLDNRGKVFQPIFELNSKYNSKLLIYLTSLTNTNSN